MSNGQQSGDTLHDNSIGWVILFVILGALIWLFWYFFDDEVRNMIRWIRYGEMWVMSHFLPEDFTYMYNGKEWSWHGSFKAVPGYEWDKMTIHHLSMFAAMTMAPLKWGFVAIFGAGAFWCYNLGPRTQFRNKLSLEALIARQSKVFPVISPLSGHCAEN